MEDVHETSSLVATDSTANLIINPVAGKEADDALAESTGGSLDATPLSPKSSPIPQTAQLILPTLIETAEPSGESVIPAIPKKGEQQLLSFPNVSSGQEDELPPASPKNFNPNTIPVTSDDPLRTPPRPQIEEKTAATGID